MNNPATGEILTSVPFMSGGDTQKAIAAASHAFSCMLSCHVLIILHFLVWLHYVNGDF